MAKYYFIAIVVGVLVGAGVFKNFTNRNKPDEVDFGK